MIVATGGMIMTSFLMSSSSAVQESGAVATSMRIQKSEFFHNEYPVSRLVLEEGDQFARLGQELNQTQLRLLFQFNTGFQALRALAQRLEYSEVERSATCHALKQISTSLYTPLGSSVHRRVGCRIASRQLGRLPDHTALPISA